jgi:hypothetical protein
MIGELTNHDLSECLRTYSANDPQLGEHRRYFLVAATSRPLPMYTVWNRVPVCSLSTLTRDLLSFCFSPSVYLHVWLIARPPAGPSILHPSVYLCTSIYLYKCVHIFIFLYVCLPIYKSIYLSIQLIYSSIYVIYPSTCF